MLFPLKGEVDVRTSVFFGMQVRMHRVKALRSRCSRMRLRMGIAPSSGTQNNLGVAAGEPHLNTRESHEKTLPIACFVMASPAATKKQQGKLYPTSIEILPASELVSVELQLQYTNYKNTLQQLASKIGDVEQEAEEHRFVLFKSIAQVIFLFC